MSVRHALARTLPGAAFAAGLCLVPLGAVGGQIVRGAVVERASRSAVAGALVTLERSTGGATFDGVVSVLTDARGEYAVRAPAAGRYRLTAKRIGVRRFVSEAFPLADGETLRIEVVLEAVVYELPEVAVTTSALCSTRRDQAARIAGLWEEARTALTATQISRRDRLFRARVVRYTRELEPRTLAVQTDQRSEVRGVMERPFKGLSGDSLSKIGYWQSLPDGSTQYYAPDADVLLSDAFLRDHCYSVVPGGRDRAGLIGLAFEPSSGRRLPDVLGTVWLDAKSFELRFVEFRYTRIDPAPFSNKIGGEVHFARLPSGAWFVQRWFIRMPRYTVYTSASPGYGIRAPSTSAPAITRLVDEGGDVFADGVSVEPPGTLSGTVMDSAGRPLPRATIRLRGTAHRAAVDAAGRFRIDSIPPGTYDVLAEQTAYAELGMEVGIERTMTFAAGESKALSFRAPTTEAIVSRLCDGRTPVRPRATLRVTVIDSVSSIPLAGIRVRLSWTELRGGPASIVEKSEAIEATADRAGAISFCELPPDRRLELWFVRDDGGTRLLAAFRAAENEIMARTVRLDRSR
jgi:hypothetical protein